MAYYEDDTGLWTGPPLPRPDKMKSLQDLSVKFLAKRLKSIKVKTYEEADQVAEYIHHLPVGIIQILHDIGFYCKFEVDTVGVNAYYFLRCFHHLQKCEPVTINRFNIEGFEQFKKKPEEMSKLKKIGLLNSGYANQPQHSEVMAIRLAPYRFVTKHLTHVTHLDLGLQGNSHLAKKESGPMVKCFKALKHLESLKFSGSYDDFKLFLNAQGNSEITVFTCDVRCEDFGVDFLWKELRKVRCCEMKLPRDTFLKISAATNQTVQVGQLERLTIEEHYQDCFFQFDSYEMDSGRKPGQSILDTTTTFFTNCPSFFPNLKEIDMREWTIYDWKNCLDQQVWPIITGLKLAVDREDFADTVRTVAVHFPKLEFFHIVIFEGLPLGDEQEDLDAIAQLKNLNILQISCCQSLLNVPKLVFNTLTNLKEFWMYTLQLPEITEENGETLLTDCFSSISKSLSLTFVSDKLSDEYDTDMLDPIEDFQHAVVDQLRNIKYFKIRLSKQLESTSEDSIAYSWSSREDFDEEEDLEVDEDLEEDGKEDEDLKEEENSEEEDLEDEELVEENDLEEEGNSEEKDLEEDENLEEENDLKEDEDLEEDSEEEDLEEDEELEEEGRKAPKRRRL